MSQKQFWIVAALGFLAFITGYFAWKAWIREPVCQEYVMLQDFKLPVEKNAPAPATSTENRIKTVVVCD